MSKKLPILVFTGPSGVGKGTLIAMLKEEFSVTLELAVSHTTRQKREHEIDGVHYHFTKIADMKNNIATNFFLEHAEVYGNLYGISFDAIEKVQKSGKICILDLDVNGVALMKSKNIPTFTIYISPPSTNELERRLLSRGTETLETYSLRMSNAFADMKIMKKIADYEIVNDKVDLAYYFLRQKLFEMYPNSFYETLTKSIWVHFEKAKRTMREAEQLSEKDYFSAGYLNATDHRMAIEKKLIDAQNAKSLAYVFYYQREAKFPL